MVIAYHVIMSFYGFWLPNDPRGSWSSWIRKWELWRYGKPTKVETRRSLAGETHDFQLRQEAKQALKYPPVVLNGEQARAVVRGFAQAAEESNYHIHACAILPDHAHVVVGRRVDRKIEQVVAHLKGRATQQLREEGVDPLDGFLTTDGGQPSPWCEGYWKVYIDSADQMRNAIAYVGRNPLKEGKRRQDWSFVQPWSESEIERIGRELREYNRGRRGKPRR